MAEEPIEQSVQSGILNAIEFGILDSAEIEKYSSFTLLEKDDVSHPKLGIPNILKERCATCGSKDVRDCSGHFGIIHLPAKIYHPYFIEEVVQILNQICPGCHSLKQDFEKDLISFEVNDKFLRCDTLFKAIQNKFSRAKRKQIFSYLKNCVKAAGKNWAKTERKSNCKYCVKSSVKWYPMVRFRILSRDIIGRRSLQITAEINEKQVPKRYQNKSLDEVLAEDYWDFVPRDVRQHEPNRNKITLTPYQAFTLLKKLDPEFIKKFIPNKEWAFLSSIPVTSNSHRISETYLAHSDGPMLVFDERTKAYRKIIDASKRIDEFRQHPQFKALAGSYLTTRTMECLNASKLFSRQSSNGERDRPPGASHGGRWIKDIILSKKTDYVFRMVMIGDPYLKLSEIGIPSEVARNLLITETVNSYNIENLRALFQKCFITEYIPARRDGVLITLKKIEDIQIGDIVYRPVQNGDIVLINRPPSVHLHSLIGLTIHILPTENVLSINPLNCVPLLGDFDGDCLHGYVPQSIACRAELNQLVQIDNQIFNSQDGNCLVSLSHDSLLAAGLLISNDTYINKYEFQQLEMYCLAKSENIWSGTVMTGLQLFSSLFPLSENYVCSSTTPKWLKGGKNGILYHVFKKYGTEGLEYLFRAQETLCEFLSMVGFTVSLSDLYLCSDSNSRNLLQEEVDMAIEEAEYALKCKQIILNPEFVPSPTSYNYDNPPIITKNAIGAFKDISSNITKLVSLHLGKDNSILKMINSGGKVNLTKLVHQTLCLGIQIPIKNFPFTIPSILDCISWNNHKATVEPGECSYAHIRSSFIDGLNPLECLVHSISGRANFGDNAEVPGTLNRELTYYLRDLYTAYDGSVRDAYGQIVRFSYGNDDDDDDNVYDFVGAPVGAWAASAVSEAAYGALDCPVSGSDQSPLMNLKKVLKCDKSGTSDAAAVLYLSPNVKKCKYGSEYASLMIQSHLEPVPFSDLVNTVMILYGGREAEGFSNSPWEIHFHLNKEILKRKRINPKYVINRLMKDYAIIRKSEEVPALRMFERCCFSTDDGINDGLALCLIVAAESSDLDTLKLKVVPLLLRCLAKGFNEIKRVEIKCTPENNVSGELFLRVTMSDAYASGHFWDVLQDACIPISDLIDWTRSQPDRIHDIYNVLGIDSTWRHYLSYLKESISDIGREIQREHLITVTDGLSVSGEFHGLSSNGLKAQKKRLGLSAPFSQACFSGPASTFVAAAKDKSIDGLCGSLDSISWGKEPSIGSGGHFDLIFNVKNNTVHQEEYFGNFGNTKSACVDGFKLQPSYCDPQEDELNKCDNIYKFLGTVLSKEPKKGQSCTLVNGEDLHKYADKKAKAKKDAITLPSEYQCGIGPWSDILDMYNSLRNMLHRYPIDTCVTDPEKLCLIVALDYHPRGAEKRGVGVKAIKIGLSDNGWESRCFKIIRYDGTEEDFSYHKCIIGAASKVSPELKIWVQTKLFQKIW